MCDLLSSTAGKIFPRLHVVLLLMIVIFHVSLSKMNPLFDEKNINSDQYITLLSLKTP